MGLWADVEHAADDVAGMLHSLRSFLTDAGLGDVVQELRRLAEQAGQVKQQLASAASSTKWTGAAASGFQHRAQQRQQQIAGLMQALDSALEAVDAAYIVAGI